MILIYYPDLDVSLKQDNVEIPKRSDPLKTTNAFKLMGELYKINGIRSLYRGGTLLFIRYIILNNKKRSKENIFLIHYHIFLEMFLVWEFICSHMNIYVAC